VSTDAEAVPLERAVEILRGMAYEHRLHILVLLRAGESTPGALAAALPVHPTAVAHHLRSLMDARLVRRRRRGRVVLYSLRHPSTGALIDEILRYAAGPEG
jgi:DNA-binding transcriptional ArsR family regulator